MTGWRPQWRVHLAQARPVAGLPIPVHATRSVRLVRATCPSETITARGAGALGPAVVRQLRRGVDADRVAPERLLRDSHSLACDARNVLLLKPAH